MEFNVKGDAQVTATGVAAALLKCCHSTLRRLYGARVHSSSLHDPSTTHEAAHYVGRRATRHVPDGEVLQPEPVQRTRHNRTYLCCAVCVSAQNLVKFADASI